MDRTAALEEQYDKVYRYCYFKLGQRELAEDITQETFLRFLESRTYKNTGRDLQYLYTVARNLCVDEYRRRKWERLPEELLETGPEERCRAGDHAPEEGWITAMLVKTALEELSEEDRELVLLRYVNGVPVSTICGLFGMSRFAVYRRIKGIIRALQERLEKEGFV